MQKRVKKEPSIKRLALLTFRALEIGLRGYPVSINVVSSKGEGVGRGGQKFWNSFSKKTKKGANVVYGWLLRRIVHSLMVSWKLVLLPFR